MTTTDTLTFTDALDALREWEGRPASVLILRAEDSRPEAVIHGRMQKGEGEYGFAHQLEQDGEVVVNFETIAGGFAAGCVILHPESFKRAERRGPDELAVFDGDRAIVLSDL
jgi:hypothetical protein